MNDSPYRFGRIYCQFCAEMVDLVSYESPDPKSARCYECDANYGSVFNDMGTVGNEQEKVHSTKEERVLDIDILKAASAEYMKERRDRLAAYGIHWGTNRGGVSK